MNTNNEKYIKTDPCTVLTAPVSLQLIQTIKLHQNKSAHCTHSFLRDFSRFDIMLVHLKLQTCCFVFPGLFSAIRSFQKLPLKLNEFEPIM